MFGFYYLGDKMSLGGRYFHSQETAKLAGREIGQ